MAQYWKQTEAARKQLFAGLPKTPRILRWPSVNNRCSSGLATHECYGHSGTISAQPTALPAGQNDAYRSQNAVKAGGVAAISRLAGNGENLR